MTATKTFRQAFSDAYPYGKEAILKVFFEFKNKFEVRESYKRNGVLYELWQHWNEVYTYTVILIDGKTCHFFNQASIAAPAVDAWEALVGITFDQYFNGCPHYSMANANEVEIIKSEKRFLEFHKIARRTEPGSPIKAQYTQIPGTPFSIGRPVMYRFGKGDQKEFFYAKGYSIQSYDLEYNLANEKRFNTRFQAVSSIGDPTYTKALNELVERLEKEKQNYVKGYWSDAPLVWNEPNPELEAKLQKQIEAVKQFQLTYAGC